MHRLHQRRAIVGLVGVVKVYHTHLKPRQGLLAPDRYYGIVICQLKLVRFSMKSSFLQLKLVRFSMKPSFLQLKLVRFSMKPSFLQLKLVRFSMKPSFVDLQRTRP